MSNRDSPYSVSTLSSSRKTARSFILQDDFIYRFRGANAFQHTRRPQTSPALSITGTRALGSGRSQRNLSSAPTTERIHQSLGDGLLMLEQGTQYVRPSIFLKLHKMHELQPKPISRDSENSPLFPIHFSPRVEKATKESYTRSQSANVSLESNSISRGIQVNIVPKSEVVKSQSLVVDIPRHPFERRKSNDDLVPRASARSPKNDRCFRSSDFPEIQIDGRSLSRTGQVRNDYMSKEHCDVLGPSTCPDCIRTRLQNNHQRKCNATVAANATDVYKLALIHERIPHLSIKEVQRKVYDGEILDKVGNISRWKEVKQNIKLSKENQNEETAKEGESSIIVKASVPQESAIRSKLRSRGSLASAVFETIVETTETDSEDDIEVVQPTYTTDNDAQSMSSDKAGDHHVVIKRHESEQPQKIDLISSGEKRVSPEIEQLTGESDTKPLLDSHHDVAMDEKSAHYKGDIVRMDSVNPERQERSRWKGNENDFEEQWISSNKPSGPNYSTRKRSRKRSPKQKKCTVFNRGLIPSPNYFHNVSDLMERIRKSNRIARTSPWEIGFDDFDKPLPVAQPLDSPEPRENYKDDTSSVGSQDSSPTRSMQTLLQFEPPIMYEKKSRYLGVKAPVPGTLASTVTG